MLGSQDISLDNVIREYPELCRENNNHRKQYCISDIIYRLSKSKYKNCLALKGSLSFNAWNKRLTRFSNDLDLQLLYKKRYIDPMSILHSITKDSIVTPYNVNYKMDNLVEMPVHNGYTSYSKFRLYAEVEGTRFPILITVWDPLLEEFWPDYLQYPTMLDIGEESSIFVTKKENMLADKLSILVEFGRDHTRVKDFYDISCITQFPSVNDDEVISAYWRALAQRQSLGYLMRGDDYWEPVLTETFATPARDRAWKSFRNSQPLETDLPENFSTVLQSVRSYVSKYLSAAQGMHYSFRKPLNVNPLPSRNYIQISPDTVEIRQSM